MTEEHLQLLYQCGLPTALRSLHANDERSCIATGLPAPSQLLEAPEEDRQIVVEDARPAWHVQITQAQSRIYLLSCIAVPLKPVQENQGLPATAASTDIVGTGCTGAAGM